MVATTKTEPEAPTTKGTADLGAQLDAAEAREPAAVAVRAEGLAAPQIQRGAACPWTAGDLPTGEVTGGPVGIWAGPRASAEGTRRDDRR